MPAKPVNPPFKRGASLVWQENGQYQGLDKCVVDYVQLRRTKVKWKELEIHTTIEYGQSRLID